MSSVLSFDRTGYEAFASKWFRLRYIILARIVANSLWLPNGLAFGIGAVITVVEWITIIRWFKRQRAKRRNRQR
jgi:hypothetical protein